jgi:hypothetical protein
MAPRIVYSAVFILFVIVACQPNKGNEQLALDFRLVGAWSYVLNDSIYGEVIFVEDRLWERHRDLGEFERKYQVNADSLIILSPEGWVDVRLKVRILSNHEFTANAMNKETRYYRIDQKQNWGNVVNRIDPDYEDYINAFGERYLQFKKQQSQ